MSVAYDNDTQALQNVNVSSVTKAHTTAGINRALLVFVDLLGVSQSVSSITYAGKALSLVRAANAGTNQRLEVWGLVNPAIGANNVIVNLSANNAAWDASAISFTGADQDASTVFNGAQVGASSNGDLSVVVTVTTGKSGDMVVAGTSSIARNVAAPGAGQTQQWSDNSGSTNTMGDTKAGAASVTMTENWDNIDLGGNQFMAIALNVAQFDPRTNPGAAGVLAIPNLMGAGGLSS